MNRWQKSVDDIQARRRQVAEVERAQQALSKVTACFQQLASSVGSNSDGSFLREEMDETRGLVYRICAGLHRRLMSLMTETEPGQEDREQVDRLWVTFISGLENFLQDLGKASDLMKLFPLSQKKDRWALVNTGVSDSVSGVAALAASVQTPWLTVHVEQCPDLKTHITQVETLLKELQQKVNVPFWSVEATQKAWVEAECQEDSHDNDGTLEEMMEADSQDSKMSVCCHPPNCKLRCVFCLLH